MTRNSYRKFAIAAFAAVVSQAANAADSLAVIAPVPRAGPYPVACSNVAQDFSRVGPNETAEMYWRGTPREDGAPRYVIELLVRARLADEAVASRGLVITRVHGR